MLSGEHKRSIKCLHKYMHRGSDRATIVIKDNVQNSKHGIGPHHYQDINEIK